LNKINLNKELPYIHGMNSNAFIPLKYEAPNKETLLEQSSSFYHKLKERRSVRHFSDREVPREAIENIIMAAGTAPSGAHKQPWAFCAVSNTEIKAKIREAAEQEEYLNYTKRMSTQWLKDLEPFDTNWEKPMLTDAPWLIVVYRKAFDVVEGEKLKNYYINESVGIACGMLITAIHQAGLVALTHTPSPMQFLVDLLERPKNEKTYLLIPVGYPAGKCEVPQLARKTIDEIAVFYE
jgi:nitroreductase